MRRLWIQIWVPLVVGWLWSVPAAAVIDVAELRSRTVIGNQVDVLVAQGVDYSLADLQSVAGAARFSRDGRDVPVFAGTRGPFWARIELTNSGVGTAGAILVVEFANFHNMTVHLPEAGGAVTRTLDVRSPQRDVDIDYRYPAYRVLLDPGQTKTVFLEIRHYSGRLPLVLWPEREFERFALTEFWLQGILLGVMLCALAYQLALSLLAREREHWSLLACVALTLLVTLSMLGYPHVFAGALANWMTLAYPSLLMLLAWSIVLFGRQFLQLATQQPWLNRALLAVEQGCVLLAGLALFRADWAGSIFLPVLAVGVALIVVSVVRQLLRRDPFAWLYLLSLMPLVLSGALATLTNRGWLPYLDHYHTVVALGFTTGILAFCFVSAYRIGRRRAERRRLAREMQRAEDRAAAQGAFLATISHEIRTPLNAITGTLELLRQQSMTDTQRHYIDLAEESSDALLSQINQILEFVRLDSEVITVDAENFDPAALLRNCVALMASRRAEAVAVRLDLSRDLPAAIRADRDKLRQIVLNLLANALKFTAAGEVCLRARVDYRREDLWLVIEVVDSGIGIPLEAQAALFERFHQADRSIRRRYGGTGLGLAICRTLANAMGGNIGVTSEPGVGSTFRVNIPVTVADGVDVEEAPIRGVSAAAKRLPLRLLLVDDSEVNQEIIGALLGAEGHEVLIAADGQVALDRLAEHPVDCVLMDLSMPVMDGFEAIRRIRASTDPRQRGVRIVAVTAHALPRTLQDCLDAGADAVLTKPIQIADLRAALAGETAAGTAPPQKAVIDPEQHASNVRLLGAKRVREMLTRQQADAADARADIAERLTRDDLPGAAARAHQLAGACSFLGLSRLGDSAARLELALRSGTPEAVRNCLADMDCVLGEVATVLSKNVDSDAATQ